MNRTEFKALILDTVPEVEVYFRNDTARIALGYIERIDQCPVYTANKEAEITNVLQLLGLQYKVREADNCGNKYMRIDVKFTGGLHD